MNLTPLRGGIQGVFDRKTTVIFRLKENRDTDNEGAGSPHGRYLKQEADKCFMVSWKRRGGVRGCKAWLKERSILELQDIP